VVVEGKMNSPRMAKTNATMGASLSSTKGEQGYEEKFLATEPDLEVLVLK